MATFVYPSAFECCVPNPLSPRGEGDLPTPEEEALACKINRARAAGPSSITTDATIADWNPDRKSYTVLHKGTNHWVCFPGHENQIGNVPMACDPMGLEWIMSAYARKPVPTNTAPGLIYMLCGANQHSTTSPGDRTSPAIPIGPHYMILWPFSAKRDGFPDTIRDEGAWVMFDGTPYAHLHICGSPEAGKVYDPKTTKAHWDLRYHDQDRS